MHHPTSPLVPYSLCKLSGLYNEATPLPSAATLYCRSPNEMDAVATPSFDWQLSRGEVRGSGLGAFASWSAISRRDSIEIFTRRVFSSHNSLFNCHWQFKNATSCCSCVAVAVVVVHVLLLFVCCCSWCCCCSSLSTLGFLIAYSTYLLAKQVAQSTVRTAPITPTAHRRPLATEPRSTTVTVAAAAL